MIQLNLLPDIKKQVIKAQRMRLKVIATSVSIAVVSGGVLALAAFYVYAGQPLQIMFARGDIAKYSEELQRKTDAKKYLTLQNQLAALPALHENKLVDSRLMTFLPLLNPQSPHDVNLSSLSLRAESTTLTFSGTANTYEALGVFIDTLKYADLAYTPVEDGASQAKTKLFTSVSLESSSLSRVRDEQVVAFTVSGVYSEYAFSNKVKNVSVQIPPVANSRSADQLTVGSDNVFNQTQGGER